MKKKPRTLSLWWKIAGLTAGTALLIGMISVLMVKRTVSQTFQHGVIEKGKVMANDLALASQMVDDAENLDVWIQTVKEMPGVSYAFIIGLPSDCKAGLDEQNAQFVVANNPAEKDGPRVARLPEVNAFDVAMPLGNGARGQVHLGMSMTHIDHEAGRMVKVVTYVVGLTMFIGIGAGFFVAGTINRRIVRLTEVANKISMGDLDTEIDVHTGDEIEKLAEAFERMTISLKTAMKKLSRG